MEYKINIVQIDAAWFSCDYKYRVFIEDTEVMNMKRFNYILATLKKWFGAAVFFCYGNGSMMFLCDRK